MGVGWRRFCLGLAHWGRDKMAAISWTTFSNAFPWMKKYTIWFKIHWSLLLRFQLTINQHWFGLWLGAEQVTSHYLNQWWPSLLKRICVSRPQWVNSCGFMVADNSACCDIWMLAGAAFDRICRLLTHICWHWCWFCQECGLARRRINRTPKSAPGELPNRLHLRCLHQPRHWLGADESVFCT